VNRQAKPQLLLFAICGLALSAALVLGLSADKPSAAAAPNATAPATDDYVVLSWNDLGMHCYNRDFQYLAVLPPYNNLWAQVVRRGDPPVVVTDGVSISYGFPENTFSVGKSNFWQYDLPLFGVDLPPNVGLAGKGLSGDMDLPPGKSYFVAEGIPLTEFRDADYAANPAHPAPYPYQLATIAVRNTATGQMLTQATTVSPVSTEMHCDYCHHDGGVEGIATGSVELNILTLHDKENQDEYPPGHTGPLTGRTPILCAECHASNALGLPGASGVPNLSKAMHEKHADKVSNDQDGCYNCHPGPQTKCLRDVMSQRGMDCVDCHGSMEHVSQNQNPWLNEPRCDSANCHGAQYAQDQALYRQSRGHGGLYCEACHDSTHAIAPSREPNDAIKFLDLQGVNLAIGAANRCSVCHTQTPDGPGPHGIRALSLHLHLPQIVR
jgi:hypothetical protein